MAVHFPPIQSNPAFYFLHQKERDGCSLPPCLQLDAPLFIPLSFPLSSLCPLVFSCLPMLEAGCETDCLIQMETSPAVTVVLLLRQSHISLFSLPERVHACGPLCVCVCVCVCVVVRVSMCVLRPCVTLAPQSQVMISSPRRWLEAYKENYARTHTHTHTLREGKMGSRDWYCNGSLMGYLTSAFS